MHREKHIRQVIENFYILTNLPIKAMDLNDNVLVSSGYNFEFSRLFEDNNIYEKAKKGLKDDNNKVAIICATDNVGFTALYISPRNIHRGIYILGPHSCKKNNMSQVPYKPRCLMKHLVGLLKVIDGDTMPKRCKLDLEHKHYNLHVRKAIDYLHANYRKVLDLEELAGYLDISKSYLCTIFKKETKKTITEYLNEVRIKKSKDLLKDSDDTMLDIALSVGYNNQNYYNIVFKKFTGMTPLNFKNKYTKN